MGLYKQIKAMHAHMPVKQNLERSIVKMSQECFGGCSQYCTGVLQLDTPTQNLLF